jgi:hypothetical protein
MIRKRQRLPELEKSLAGVDENESRRSQGIDVVLFLYGL